MLQNIFLCFIKELEGLPNTLITTSAQSSLISKSVILEIIILIFTTVMRKLAIAFCNKQM